MENRLDALETLLVQLCIVVVLFSMGLQLTGSQILAAISQRQLLAKALIANLILLPLLALLLSRLVQMPQEIAIGFLLAAAAPGAPLTTKLAEIGRANRPFAVGLMFILSILAIVTTPLTASLILPTETTTQFEPVQIIAVLITFQFIPLLVGLATHHWWASLARRLVRPSIILGNILFAAVVILIVARDLPALIAIPWPTLAAMILLTIASLITGWFFGGPDQQTRRALAIGTSVEFSGLALLITGTSFANTTADIGVVAFGLIMIVTNTTLAIYWSRQHPISTFEEGIYPL